MWLGVVFLFYKRLFAATDSSSVSDQCCQITNSFKSTLFFNRVWNVEMECGLWNMLKMHVETKMEFRILFFKFIFRLKEIWIQIFLDFLEMFERNITFEPFFELCSGLFISRTLLLLLFQILINFYSHWLVVLRK